MSLSFLGVRFLARVPVGTSNTCITFVKRAELLIIVLIFLFRYLYHFLKSNSASDDELTTVLEDLIELDSTSEYLEDLIELKIKSGTSLSLITSWQ